MAKKIKEPPEIYADRFARLEPDEIKYIRDTLNNHVFAKFLRVVEAMKPSCMEPGTYGTLVSQNTGIISAIRLAEMRGWELHLGAMLKAIADKPAPKVPVEATYPNSGMDLTK